MGLSKKNFHIYILLFFFLAHPVFAQIVFKELPGYRPGLDSSFFDITQTRSLIFLNGAWKVYPAGSKEKKSTMVSVPSVFKGEADLTFEKEFSLTPAELNNNILFLHFLGVNYSADISINNIIIYRHTGGEFPFYFELPHDILRYDKKNILTVKLFYKLDSENTIPVKQRFLFPQSFGGIFRDVYIHLVPDIFISDINLLQNYDAKGNKAELKIKTGIDNKEFRNPADTAEEAVSNFNLKVKVTQPDGSSAGSFENKFTLSINKNIFINQTVEIKNPLLWSASYPAVYSVSIELWKDENLIDVTKKEIGIYSLTAENDALLFNGNPFQFKGVTYIPSFEEFGNLAAYSRMEEDIKMIKDLGFNSIRFTKSVPHPYYLKLCNKYGLLALVELPINFIPASLSSDKDFIIRSQNYLTNFIKAFKDYSAVAALGVCSSVLPNVEENISLVENLSILAKSNFPGLVYASFISTDEIKIPRIKDIDLYGIEFLNSPIETDFEKLNQIQNEMGKGRVFISSASYIVNQGKSDGFVNSFSYEAQAKYFDDLTDYADKDSAGYFINTMFDYRGDYSSLIAGFNKNNIYHLGIVGEDRNTDRIGYKVLYAKFHNMEKVTIPIGSRKDNAPMVFIIMGILLAFIMGILVNSGRKFREDASRALVRPYNFYADVRDQRIISGFHSTFLALVISAVLSLIFANLLFYFKMSTEFEKILISFGSPRLIEAVSYLSWNPLMSLLWLTIFFMVLLLISTVIIKIASFFVRNRVYYSSIYFSTVWSFLPFVLLILVGIILYRLLLADVANLYIYLLLAVFCLWVFYRLMKGIYVIFDVNPGGVYFYSIILVAAIIGIVVIYYELKNSFVDYLLLTLKQY